MECDARGVAPRPDLCQQAGVRVFPTWVVQGKRHEGVLSLDRLAELSGFRPAAR
ncbi:MAG TPA: hypothetical protein VFX28_02680 [Methylomirabilota bacterium]|nr:hypothetical protein [Methylomirabilota bacterium]